MTEGGQNQREHYRIFYRAPDQPVFQCDQGKFPVLDISEGGFRFSFKKGALFLEKDYLEGTIHLPNKRGTVFVKGHVLRVFDQEIAVHLDADGRIPLARIMEEQRILIQKGRL
ncbi:PilZ domain-containing protein [Oligoflexus tunisiensis]|uniref:PilZ domain-containing protein n=1 Tax=Oligoflexus tunisiensis TaxID=708132 RepID=UPI00114CD3F9|nr:PilZ domain-containing protein [Oligoflexus tunisiensis]